MKRLKINKKRILDYIKTYHACERQKERGICDSTLAKVLMYGEFVDRGEHQRVIVFEGHQVFLCHDLENIITVVAADKEPSAPKVLTTKEAKEIKSIIRTIEKEEEIEKELTFEDYLNTGKYN